MVRILFKTNNAPPREDVDAANLPAMIAEAAEGRAMLWVDLKDDLPGAPDESSVEHSADADIQRILREDFKFDPLAVDDALAETHVPKVDDWTSYLYIVLHAVFFQSEIEDIDTRELDVFLGKNFLVTYHFEELPELHQVWRLVQRDDRYWKRGADYLFYTLADSIATGYMPCMDAIDEVSDQILDTVFDHPSREQVQHIFHVKRAVLRLRRILGPQREVMSRMAREGLSQVDGKNRVYFRDVYDHFVRMADLNESLRDIVAGSLDTYLSVTANRTNDVMKVLTIVTVLFAPLTFITGFFGMNFFGDNVLLPGNFGWVPFVLAMLGMVVFPALIFLYIRRSRWV